MDELALRRRSSFLEDYEVVDIYINGINLIDLLRSVEGIYAQQEGQSSLAGAYEGLPPLLTLPPNRHFWGEAQHRDYQYGAQRVSLLEYRYSGVPGDWTFVADIEVGANAVVWRGFEQVKRPDWSYAALGNFEFDLNAYRDALHQASRGLFG